MTHSVEHPALFSGTIVRIHHSALLIICADRIAVDLAKFIIWTDHLKNKLAVFFPRPSEIEIAFPIVLFLTLFSKPIHTGAAINLPLFFGSFVGCKHLYSILAYPKFIGRDEVGDNQHSKGEFLHVEQSLGEGCTGTYVKSSRDLQ